MICAGFKRKYVDINGIAFKVNTAEIQGVKQIDHMVLEDGRVLEFTLKCKWTAKTQISELCPEGVFLYMKDLGAGYPSSGPITTEPAS